MKVSKRIIIWIAIALVIENSLFLFLDKYYLKTDTNFKATKVEKEVKNDKKSIEVKFPKDVDNLTVSFNGKYVSYIKDNNIYVATVDTGETKKIPLQEGSSPMFYKWLSDINRMIIAERYDKEKKIRFSYYDVKINESVNVNDYLNNEEVYIPLKSTSDKIEDITISTKTQVMYVKVAQKGNAAAFYRIDRMSRLEPLKLTSKIVGNIASTNHDDKLIFEDSTYHRIGISDMPALKFKDIKEPVLISVDDNDTIYIGQSEKGKVTKVYYGKLREKPSDWKTYIPDEPLYKEDIIVSSDGKIFADNSLKGNIKEESSGNVTNYEGRFLRICSDSIYSILEDKLLITGLKK